ncbi:phosphatase PAP2 family protein [Hymenobacter properus]|uniref:Phosphatase PAP2 family protein n=1 Tax=Hymenobacter properus TaxID=2791026 RepID=A0A931BHG9_9BACT|nr:phosphatase PAP2 family protein [Hymenobacter properus]MBF9140283.1 phosphatase PAP2 family protein [Hymenobacter properus]MBR7719090.1 phosphatase PAP2 family protein [Microvirga sp. SRT04]
MLLRPLLSLALLAELAVLPRLATAQTPVPTDTTHKYQNPPGALAPPKKSFFRSKGFRATIIPAALIGYGASTIYGNGLYSSYQAKRAIRSEFGTYRNHTDDYLQWAPYLEIPGVLLAGVESRNDRLNLALVVAKSELIMLGSVYIVKTLTHIQRPDSSDHLSFPSGHTAQAFLAASIVHAEFRDKSQWYGVGAYALATSVAAFRMINNKHWQSDVVAGAGFGILSAHMAYLSHRNRWGRKPGGRGIGETSLLPVWTPTGGMGLCFNWRPK